MRAVIDTSVLISGMLSRKSYPAKVIDAWVFGKFIPVVSPDLIKEYTSVFARDKFAPLGTIQERMKLLEKILKLPWVVLVYPTRKNLPEKLKDIGDLKVLECASEGNAEWIVTGDRHLLELRFFEDTAIVTAERFFKNQLTSSP